MQTLYVFGDSFATPFVDENNLSQPEMVEFPKIVADTFNLDCINYSIPGQSNFHIVELIKKHKSRITEKDIVLVALSNPYRDLLDQTPSSMLSNLLNHIEEINTTFKNNKVLITAAFNPICPYDFSAEELKKYKVENFLHWGKPNNTLMDYVTGTWLDESKMNVIAQEGVDRLRFLRLKKPKTYKNLQACMHFNTNGHKLVAEMIVEEMEGRLSLSRRSRHARIL